MNMKLSRTLSTMLDDPRLFRQYAYVDGKWTHGDGGREEAVIDPATGEVIGHIPWLEADQIRAAVDAAEAAFVHCAPCVPTSAASACWPGTTCCRPTARTWPPS